MPVGTAGACRRIQLMVRLADIDSYAIGGRRNAHCTLTVCEGEHAVRVRYRAVDRAFAAQRNVGNAADSSEIRIPHQTGYTSPKDHSSRSQHRSNSACRYTD